MFTTALPAAASTVATPVVFDLPAGRTLGAPDGLLAFLHRHRMRDIALNAALVPRLDSALVQAMILAAQDWKLRGHGLWLTGLAAAQLAELAALGVTQDDLPHQAA